MEPTMIELINQALTGDMDAQTQLYMLTKNKAYYLALQLLKNPQDAEDVMQDAYITAFSKLGTLDNANKFQGWLDTIVINRAKDVLKKKKPIVFADMKSTDDEEYEPEIIEDRIEFQPQENLDYQETKRLVQEIIDGLSEEQRIAVMLYYYKEMSVAEIAAYSECSAGTIKSRLNYARKTIKSKVEELAKNGTKLYSIPALPFLYWMFQSEAGEAICTSAKVLHGIQTSSAFCKVSGEAVRKSTESIVKEASANGLKGATSAATKAGALSVGMKTGIAVVVVAVGLAGGIAVYKTSVPQTNVEVNTSVDDGATEEAVIDKENDKSVTAQIESAESEEKSIEDINKEAKQAYAEVIPSVFSEFYEEALADVDRYFAFDDINGDGIVECIVFADEMKDCGHKDEITYVPYTRAIYIMTYYDESVTKILDSSQEADNFIIDKEKGYIISEVSMSGIYGSSYFTIDDGTFKLMKSFSHIDESYMVDDDTVTEEEYDDEVSKYWRGMEEMEEMTFYRVSDEAVNNIINN